MLLRLIVLPTLLEVLRSPLLLEGRLGIAEFTGKGREEKGRWEKEDAENARTVRTAASEEHEHAWTASTKNLERHLIISAVEYSV